MCFVFWLGYQKRTDINLYSVHCSCSAESINCTNVAGKIVLCDDGEPPARAVAADGYLQDVAKRLNEAKAAGVIVARPPLGLLSTCQVLCVNVDRGRRARILAYVASSRFASFSLVLDILQRREANVPI